MTMHRVSLATKTIPWNEVRANALAAGFVIGLCLVPTAIGAGILSLLMSLF
ncbi:hypothetical protein MN032_04120 [Agromyces atrinae]|uniref:hypothetical protein n=1 Tax=Agromyces atrinae TaxID=592376 RepID=UPI001F55EEBB|nr:hypothetical protein [Agromyces atrinae]MCI2956870.1 hypothetical protein [Agromyces atrinae]